MPHLKLYVFTLVALVVAPGTVLPCVAQAAGPLRVHPENPRYFTDDSGAAVYLTGSHTWSNLQDQGATEPVPAFDFDRYLDFLQRHHHNFIRLWAWEQTRWAPWSDGKGKDPHDWFIEPNPYARTGPGTARDGKRKFDLTRFDPVYFDRLRDRVHKAHNRGIYVSIMLFQGWSSAKGWYGGRPWLGHPYHAENNVQGFDGNPASDAGPDLNNPHVRQHQATYLRKVVDTVNDLDNVLYEVTNEGGNKEWDWWVVRTVQEYEQTKPRQHPMGLTGHGSESNEEMLASPAAWFSPGSSGWDDLKTDPRAYAGPKPALLDTDHVFGVGGDRQWVWKAFTRGYNVLFMDPYDDPQWVPILEAQGVGTHDVAGARAAMGHTRHLAQRVDLVAARPIPELASSGYCLANPGREYVVYLPAGGEVKVDLRGAAQKQFSVEWIHPVTGDITTAIAVQGGDWRLLKSPFTGDAAAYLQRQDKRR